jgi:diadenosine tetraphosphate (Ap4A) HIT family hydrolase
MNATLRKFGFPETLVRDYVHWSLLLRPQQATLGALVLVNKESACAFGDLSAASFTELAGVTRELESALRETFAYDKINYLMLMMVDPDVHFHVLPRYGQPSRFAELSFEDPGWPGPPRLDLVTETTSAVNARIITALQNNWPTRAAAGTRP